MVNLNKLLTMMIISEANFRTIHWMVAGMKFNEMHLGADDFRKMVADDIDVVAEMILRRTDSIPTLKNVCGNERLIYDPEGNYIDFPKYLSLVSTILNGIKNAIGECLADPEITENPENVGIKAELEGLYNKYDLQANYLIKRRFAR